MARILLLWSVVVALGLLCGAYVVNTILYLAPPNPVTARHLPTIFALEHPFFTQNWHLFAPNPVRSNFILNARCRLGDRVTAWQDLTEPMLARHHRDRSSPMSRLLRIQQNGIRMLLMAPPDDWRGLICKKDRQAALCRGADPEGRRRREIGQYLLQREATAACAGQLAPALPEAVQVRVLVHQPPFWSQRQLGDEAGTTRYVLFPWGRPVDAHTPSGPTSTQP